MARTEAVAIDVMGSDRGVAIMVQGAVAAAQEYNIAIRLVGNQQEIEAALSSIQGVPKDGIAVVHAEQVVEMDDSPSAVLRTKLESSISKAYHEVIEQRACAVVSPGNTGAFMAAGRFLCGTLPGIARPAIASLLPRPGDLPPVVLVDSGANVDCHKEQLVQFAVMGRHYSSLVSSIERPRVALLSNGSEESKGSDTTRAAALALREIPDLDYIGYVEGRDICRDMADVIVCDGFVGNIVLKTMEGTAEFVFDAIRDHVERTFRGMLGLWLAKPHLRSLFRDKLDPSAYGGAPLLGLQHIALACHGSSDGRAITNAVVAAHRFHVNGLIEKMSHALTELELSPQGVYEDGMWKKLGRRFERGASRQPKESNGINAGESVEEAPAEGSLGSKDEKVE